MKLASLLALTAAASLVGCTTTTETSTTTTRTAAATADSRSGASPIDQNRIIHKRTYSQSDIQKTGRASGSGNVGEALSSLDAGVFISGGGR